MPFVLIEGTFHIQGYDPDGDSIKFRARNKANWRKLKGRRLRLNKSEHVQLRFEGVDALEVHYNGTHQPLNFANQATDYMLTVLGITDVRWKLDRSEVLSVDDGSPGYILARRTDKHGRPVAFVFAGGSGKRDGSAVFLNTKILRKSVNYKLLAEGLAYPMYYDGLFSDLRDAMTMAVGRARHADRGIWPYDWTTVGVLVKSIESISNEYVVMPKLFRRMVNYLENQSSIRGLKDHLSRNPERILILSTGHVTNLDTVIEERGRTVQLTTAPEDLVFFR